MKRSILFWNIIGSIVTLSVCICLTHKVYIDYIYANSISNIQNHLDSMIYGEIYKPHIISIYNFIINSFLLKTNLFVTYIIVLVIQYLIILFTSIDRLVKEELENCHTKPIKEITKEIFFLFFNPLFYYIILLYYFYLLVLHLNKMLIEFNIYLDRKTN
jgi:F0F1-type ATP synthase assembly protein I